MLKLLAAVVFILSLTPFQATGRELTIVSWNLGWHMDKSLLAQWIDACGALYEKDAQNVWRPSVTGTGTPAWDIDVYRDLDTWDKNNLPVCDVYKSGPADTIPVTEAAYDRREQTMRDFFTKSVPADIYVFQEVSSEASVREVLPNGGANYAVCTFSDYKVQRLAIAWRRSLGAELACAPRSELSRLPEAEIKDQPRPGLKLRLSIDGKELNVLAVHLKSGCVSPFAKGDALAGDDDACEILQKQVAPLEAWVTESAAEAGPTILLGDFNRNLWHESFFTGSVRTDGSDPSGPLPAGVLASNMKSEVFDAVPPSTAFRLLPELCPLPDPDLAVVAALVCNMSEHRILDPGEVNMLGSSNFLGCRNPVGLDHVLLEPGLEAVGGVATHVSIRGGGISRKANRNHPVAQLAMSDHCPISVRVLL